eukprot:CAMPEP_0172932676 /NCGR_PEP_ID=MMETSP1075-20121228/220120_1 /TAXON_ID=2916 /ORGANISM="Ceratium fusus, Strain PA161109" /LENGTH=84 /DNA_ID=CAMNT_0013794007 /DNA_START=857 /DNA_END=1111 /DNA_ORIENTATION=+
MESKGAGKGDPAGEAIGEAAGATTGAVTGTWRARFIMVSPAMKPTLRFGAGRLNLVLLGTTTFGHSPHETGHKSLPTEDPPLVS